MELLEEGDVRSLLAVLDALEAPALDEPECASSQCAASPQSLAASSSSSRSESSASPASSPSSGAAASNGAPADGNQKKKKKKRNPATSSTALQRRKREEIQALREESAALEEQLKQLKRVHAGTAGEAVGAKRRAGPARSVWQELAILHARERQRAELTNKKLKEILSNQQEVNDALQALVAKRSVLQVIAAQTLLLGPGAPTDLLLSNLQDMGAILDEKPLYRTPIKVDCTPSVIDMLEKQVEAMYISMERPVANSPPSMVSSTTELLRTPTHGQTIQVVTTTPLRCSMEETADMLWKNMTTKQVYPDKSYNFFRRVDNEAIEKNFVMLVRDTDMNFQVNGLQFMRKYVEKDRVVIIRTDLLLLPTNSLRFRDRVWTTISRASFGQREGSVVHVRYQVNAETDDDCDAASADLSYTQQFLMQRLSSNSRAYEQTLQSQLISEDLRRRSGVQAAF